VKTIHHVTDMDAETRTVWNALTTQAGLASWWTTEVSAPEPRIGSIIRFAFVPGDFNPEMQITKLEPPTSLEWKCVGGHAPWADNTFRFEQVRLDRDRTRLRFWQDYATELDDDAYGTYSFNWGYYLESLRLYCDTGQGKPFNPANYRLRV